MRGLSILMAWWGSNLDWKVHASWKDNFRMVWRFTTLGFGYIHRQNNYGIRDRCEITDFFSAVPWNGTVLKLKPIIARDALDSKLRSSFCPFHLTLGEYNIIDLGCRAVVIVGDKNPDLFIMRVAKILMGIVGPHSLCFISFNFLNLNCDLSAASATVSKKWSIGWRFLMWYDARMEIIPIDI